MPVARPATQNFVKAVSQVFVAGSEASDFLPGLAAFSYAADKNFQCRNARPQPSLVIQSGMRIVPSQLAAWNK
jgi:hypothetical protein